MSVNRHDPDRPPIGSGIELEVHRPHPVGRSSRIALLRAAMIGLTQVRAIVYSSVMFENRRWLAITDEHRGAGYPLIAPSFRESMSRSETSLMLKPVSQVRILPGAQPLLCRSPVLLSGATGCFADPGQVDRGRRLGCSPICAIDCLALPCQSPSHGIGFKRAGSYILVDPACLPETPALGGTERHPWVEHAFLAFSASLARSAGRSTPSGST